MSSLKARIIGAVVSDLRSQFRCPPKSFSAKLLTKHWAAETKSLVELVVEKLGIRPGENVLEVGYGRGHGLQAALDKLPVDDGTVFGLEASPYMDQLASKRFVLEIADENRLVLELITNIAHMPYSNDVFNKLFHVDVFYFWEQPSMPLIMREFFRVMRPGGRIVCGLELKRLQTLEARGILTAAQYNPLRYIEELEPAGFVDVRVTYETQPASSAEYMLISGRKPDLSEADLDPETKMKKLEEAIKEELALQSLVSSKKQMSRKTTTKLEDAQGI